ncbi:hypothetical protein SPRG_19969 [Saprolegnia parasitica CBS 223.65]|uniref:HIT-type domain-containing protein n=1 Tax=Saprolegnia parasitica (strain CBS 223.65) TaxID=695850 RepID=A0A067CHW4_SAPPC|nr:hypothetical protein SPRG_19969 [Saprolegnia parasitica CBS 223.65]KDO28755.1 hypothetical protein SPRG_19969 [Saprolegnia parasitica CBS 223.65]|eukprot:XP_012200501.1 hypothetical protein SPRG_19969 [Saprolegnia parasitica CBS 223.65]
MSSLPITDGISLSMAAPTPVATDDAAAPASDVGGEKRKREEVDCAMCSALEIKYRCPKCERITCSLKCCLEHKTHYDCDGKRDRTKYIPMAAFKDADITSDYFFLQEIARSASTINALAQQTAPKGNYKKLTKKARANPELPADWLGRFPAAWQNFAKAAIDKGVDVSLLAPGMSKRKANTSCVKGHVLHWRIELHFINLSPVSKIVQARWDESKSLNDLLDDLLAIRVDTAALRTTLKPYMKASRATWRFLLRKEFVPASAPQYFTIDPAKSMAENLRGLAVVEFPILHVVLEQDMHKYVLAHRVIEEVALPS